MRKRRNEGPPAPFVLPADVRRLLGDEADQLLEALQRPAPTSIRLNPAKGATHAGWPVPWCATGRYLDERPVFTLDPLLHAGTYYVQEASSMLLEQAVKACAPPPDARVLDLCSAPGGKGTHLAALLAPEALLVCNEPVRTRQHALQENLWKWGRPDVVVTGSTPQDLAPLGAFFDLIVVDAPCSGEGMFRKDAFARAQWSERLVESCALQQRGIVDAAWNALAPGGCLIYSTCTWEERENERQVRHLLDQGGDFVPLPIDPAWGVVATAAGFRCYPHRVAGEGFFIAAVRKPGERPPRPAARTAPAVTMPDVHAWLPPGTALTPAADGTLHAVTARWADSAARLEAHLHVLSPGIPVAVHKGGNWRPHPALALSTKLVPGAFPTLDLDLTEALRYLRGEALEADGTAEGIALVRHAGHGLGWVSGAGRRWNNGWPAPWRIRMR